MKTVYKLIRLSGLHVFDFVVKQLRIQLHYVKSISLFSFKLHPFASNEVEEAKRQNPKVLNSETHTRTAISITWRDAAYQ